MTRALKISCSAGIAFLLSFGLAAVAQQSNSARIRFIFEDPQLQPASYVIDINEDGTGHFQSKPGSASSDDPEGITPQPVDVSITIDEPLRSALFKTARSHNYFNVACASTKSRVAFTGKKALQYVGPDGNGSCTFNWSRDAQVMKIAEDLIAVAFTIEEGRRLGLEHEHNRLSLDSELQNLADAAKEGRAQQIQNIAPQLQAIIADQNVMERARSRARLLLAASGKS